MDLYATSAMEGHQNVHPKLSHLELHRLQLCDLNFTKTMPRIEVIFDSPMAGANAACRPLFSILPRTTEVRKPMPKKFHDNFFVTPPPRSPFSAKKEDADAHHIDLWPSKTKTSDQRQIRRKLDASLKIPDESMDDPRPAHRMMPSLMPRNIARNLEAPSSAIRTESSSVANGRSGFPKQDRAIPNDCEEDSVSDKRNISLVDVDDASGDVSESPLPYLDIDEETLKGNLLPIHLTMKLTASRSRSPKNQSHFDHFVSLDTDCFF